MIKFKGGRNLEMDEEQKMGEDVGTSQGWLMGDE